MLYKDQYPGNSDDQERWNSTQTHVPPESYEQSITYDE
jgi:hypothetical protein